MITFLIGLLLVAVFGNIIFAVMFCVVLSKIVNVDAQTTHSWREVCHICSERLTIISALLAFFEVHTIASEDNLLVNQVKEIQNKMIHFRAAADSYLDPDKSEKFELAQVQFGDLIFRLIQTMDTYPHIVKKPEYITAKAALNMCEDRLEAAVVKHNGIARNCNRLIVSFPGPLVATMMHFSIKAVLTKKMTKVNERLAGKSLLES